MALDLRKECLAEGLERGGLLVGVRVLGFEVGDEFGGLFLPHPLVVVDDAIAVVFAGERPPCCGWGYKCHGLRVIQPNLTRIQQCDFHSNERYSS